MLDCMMIKKFSYVSVKLNSSIHQPTKNPKNFNPWQLQRSHNIFMLSVILLKPFFFISTKTQNSSYSFTTTSTHSTTNLWCDLNAYFNSWAPKRLSMRDTMNSLSGACILHEKWEVERDKRMRWEFLMLFSVFFCVVHRSSCATLCSVYSDSYKLLFFRVGEKRLYPDNGLLILRLPKFAFSFVFHFKTLTKVKPVINDSDSVLYWWWSTNCLLNFKGLLRENIKI
jgi:hypothetical protein